MKTFNRFIHEAAILEATDTDVDTAADAKKQVVMQITTYLQRFGNQESGDVKGMLLLIAALNVLNSGGDDAYAISTAKRLAQLAFVRTGKTKKKDS